MGAKQRPEASEADLRTSIGLIRFDVKCIAPCVACEISLGFRSFWFLDLNHTVMGSNKVVYGLFGF